MQGHPKQAEVEADLMATYAKRPSLAMVDSNKVGKILKGQHRKMLWPVLRGKDLRQSLFSFDMEMLREKLQISKQQKYIYACRKKSLVMSKSSKPLYRIVFT
jgi:hypothetical protein